MISMLFTIFLVTLVYYLRRKLTYWNRKRVPGPTPWPFFGNIFQSFTKKKTVGQIFRKIYSKYDQWPVVGVYRTHDPVLLVRDPEFISRIFVKDSKYFYNNDFCVDPELDPLQGASPFVQKDEQWKETRTMLSPGFTSGKMKSLFYLIETVDRKLSKYIDSQKGKTLETQNLCRRYTLENVALSAFGIDGRCFESTQESDFMKLANAFIAPGTFALSMLQMFPLISNLISLKVIPRQVETRLTEIITDVLRYRKNGNSEVKDYLQFISELGNKRKLSNVEITAHAATFFEDGYETSALVMSYVLFNLAQNPEAQVRVREEIKEFEEKSEANRVSYEDLQDMVFTNACIYESMRLHPVLEHYTRVCSKPYVYTTSRQTASHLRSMAVNIDPGTVGIIPFGGLCHDERYFPNPEKYMPERFLEKENSFKQVFYPFGGGHRVCLGQRFGMMQVRMGIIQIIKNYEVTLSEKTKLPFEFLPWTILNKVRHGIWLDYKRIS
ncbi:probable cytochrome P450 28a5 [Sitophilus oryzae]|uniref:Probable cytochrome P450 28a5 n=1 Tax=Sitophilus oryzae TaxID=7048 RepID=A0A6J2XJC4_SITOR|nr:probable cytochrome P450 28a5 [Sitophilus oryzae]